MPPETRYAKSGDVNIAYQVVGDAPRDLVFVPGFVSNVELWWEEPLTAHFFERLASYTRLIIFDKRGTGLSDRVAGVPTLEQRMDDVRAVMDAAGSERSALMGVSEGGAMSVLFAATYPDRTSALILVNTTVLSRKRTPEEQLRVIEQMVAAWGTGASADRYAPSVANDPHWRQWWARWERSGASPGAAGALRRMNMLIDVQAVLPAIRVPTLVLQTAGDLVINVERVREAARDIPGAKYVELPGTDHAAWFGDSGAMLDEVEEFLTGVRPAIEPDRVLATMLFTDIVGSTERASQLGDRRWRDLLDQHHVVIRRELDRFRGREVDTAGDGFFATFDGPARAIRCAGAVQQAVRTLGLQVRAGLHTGEIEMAKDRVSGIAVHIGARVSALAGAGEILVSSTVKDLVGGSGLRFVDRGMHQLKGVSDEWRLFAVEQGSLQQPAAV